MKQFSISSFFLSLIFLTALYQPVSAQNFHLVKDINTSTDGNPYNSNASINNSNRSKVYAVMNGISYFAADDGVHGKGLWRSDGTAQGTYQVKDSVAPDNIIVSAGRLYFIGAGSVGLWKSDGTADGTAPILDTVPQGLRGFVPYCLTDFNGTVFFVIYGSTYNDQLWKTDGTAKGTVLVKNFYDSIQQKSFGALSKLTAIKNKLYFCAEPFGNNGARLWVSNGFKEGTHIINQTIADPAQLIAGSKDNSDSLVYFTASASIGFSARYLYATNGDSGNTTIAKGFNGVTTNNYQSYLNEDLLNIEGFIYFIGGFNYNGNSQSLFRYNISGTNGIQAIKTVSGTNSSGSSSYVYSLTNLNNSIFFSLYDGPANKSQLWKSDGSGQQNTLLKDSIDCANYLSSNSLLFFSTTDKWHGSELWRSDGSSIGTVMLKDINTGLNSSYPNSLTYINNKVLFSARDSAFGLELWQTDGTAAGTTLLKDINQNASSSSSPKGLTATNNSLIFSAFESRNNYYGNSMWKSDGTNSGTKIVNDSLYQKYVYDNSFAILNDSIYFVGYSLSGKQGLYKVSITNGTPILITDFKGDIVALYGITATSSLVYFQVANQRLNRFELWRTDGTNANTYILKYGFDSYNDVVPSGNNVYFIFPNDHSLWKTDGTVAGTVMLKTFIYDPHYLAAHNGKLFFNCYDGTNNKLWKTDGTSSGTVKVTEKVVGPENFISSNGELFFKATGSAVYANAGTEVFKTDGTDSGTLLIKEIHPGNVYSFFDLKISVNGTLFFYTNGIGSDTLELWKTNGITEGTQFISRVGKADGRSPYKTISCNGKLFFVLSDVLWESDGTSGGTHKTKDDIFNSINIYDKNANLTSVANQLFFTASNYQYGEELYAGNITAPIIPYLTAANGNWNDPATWAGNVVPPAGANVVIRHTVTGNMNTTCNTLNVEAAGQLTINTGISIKILQ